MIKCIKSSTVGARPKLRGAVFFALGLLIGITPACQAEKSVRSVSASPTENTARERQELPATEIPVSDGFAYPLGDGKRLTPKSDGDGWYDAQPFGANRHLGEDWNGEAGGNSDCGAEVFAAANGYIVYAQDAGQGWGNVVIVRHRLADGTQVETLYGHLKDITKTSGTIARHELIGHIGDGNGAYKCHLHFELREQSCPAWGFPGVGYSAENAGWLAPSKFIDKNYAKKSSARP